MRLFLIIFLGLFLNERAYSQNTDDLIQDIKVFVKKVDSLSSIETILKQDTAALQQEIEEGPIWTKRGSLKGGFSTMIVTDSKNSVYSIQYHDNLLKNIYKYFYYRSDKLIFSKIMMKDNRGDNNILFLQEVFFNNDKMLLSIIDSNKLKKKYRWRIDIDPLLNGYSYLNNYKARRNKSK